MKTANGENLKIIHQGLLNKNAGADFSNSKIHLGETIWQGILKFISRLQIG
ncbi:DUF2851 family protein [Pedobacter sp. MC2016-05]|uniref:DUF2851 family protein n=1 Tax=Pedobacter sp. MC2016-05 TaxID=2994474 RepID=UPI003A5226C8